jgi:WD40 repeat protein
MNAEGTESPFKGLAAFEDSDVDARLFFGREREREIIVANLLASRLTVLYGESGVGKSSVLRAGVARDLRALPEPLAVVVFADWRDDPVRALESRIADATGAEPQGRLADTLELGAGLAGGEVFVILDGLEEEFVYHGPDIGPGSFLDEFSEAATRPGIRASFLLAVREDSLAKLDRFKGRVPNVFGNYLRLDRLDRTAGREAILGPVDRYNESSTDGWVEVEPALVEAVLDQVAAGKVELRATGRGARANGASGGIEAPFLQLVMARLWAAEAAQSSGVLRLETLEGLGGAEQIVRDHLEQALASLDDEQQDVSAAVFNHLVTPSGTKIAHDASDLAGYLGTSSRHLEPVLALLAAQRILRPVPGTEGSDQPRYEIYHDILADPVLAWRSRHESEREVERVRDVAARRHRRLLVIAVAAVLLAGAMAGVTVFAFSQRSEAQRQADRARRADDAVLRKNAQLKRANNNVNQKNAQLKRASNTVNQKNAQLRQANNTVNQKNAELNQANSTVNQKNAQLNQKNAELNQANSTVNQKNAQLNQKNAELNQANSTVNQKNAQLNHKNAQLNKANNTVNQKNAELHSSNTQLSVANKRATARALAATALAELNTAPEQALNDALNSAEINPSGAENVLRQALDASRVRSILPAGGPASGASVSPDGSFLVTADANKQTGGIARIYRMNGRLVHTLRVGSHVRDTAVSPDGRLVATASKDGWARVWNVATGELIYKLPCGGVPLNSVSFSRDGKLLATGGNDKRARIWDVATGDRLQVIAHPRGVLSVSFSPNDRLLLTVDGLDARLFGVSSGQPVGKQMEQQDPVSGQQQPIHHAAFSPNGEFVATAGIGTHAVVELWNVAAGVAVAPALVGHRGDILGLDFSADGRLLVTASEDGTADIWNVPSGTLKTVLGGHRLAVVSASFSGDGRFVVTASADDTARVWDDNGGLPLAVLAGHVDSLTGAAFTPQGLVVTASADGSVRVWNPGTADQLHPLGPPFSALSCAAISPDSKLALGAGAGFLRVWHVGGGLVRTLVLGGNLTACSFSADGRLAMAASDDGEARVWRVSDWRPLATFPQGAAIRSAELSPDGAFATTAGTDGTVKVWSVKTGKLLQTLMVGGLGAVAAFGRDGSEIATGGSDGIVRIWRARDGRLLQSLVGRDHPAIGALAFSPDGLRVATASTDKKIPIAQVWNLRTKTSTELKRHTDALTSVSFSHDGSSLVTTSVDHLAILWRTADGKRLQTLGQSGVISSAAFSADDRWLVTAGPAAALLWKTGVGQPSFSMLLGDSHHQLKSVAFSSNGWRIVTAGVDGTVRTFDCKLCGSLPQLVSMAKAKLSSLRRGLTHADRRRYLGMR